MTLLKYAARSAESISTVTVLPEAIVSIPTPAAISKEESRRFIEPVPVSATVFNTVATVIVPALSTKPEPSTVITGIAEPEPYVPAVTVVPVLVMFVNVAESATTWPVILTPVLVVLNFLLLL